MGHQPNPDHQQQLEQCWASGLFRAVAVRPSSRSSTRCILENMRGLYIADLKHIMAMLVNKNRPDQEILVPDWLITCKIGVWHRQREWDIVTGLRGRARLGRFRGD